MAEDDSLAGLQSLHRDLCAFVDLKLPVLDRLLQKFELRLDELKALLDKPGKHDKSRQAVNSGKITIDGDEYEVNDDFKQQTLELADVLNLDELKAAQEFLESQTESKELDRPQFQTAVIRFHRRREYVLLCLRILFKAALDNDDTDYEGYDTLFKVAHVILDVEGINFANAHQFWDKCFKAMCDIEVWLQQIGETVAKAKLVGQAPVPMFVEIFDFQRQSLTRQHENLAAICAHMVKPGFADLNNFKRLLEKIKSLDRHDILTIHYVPMAMRLCAWVALEANTETRAARSLHQTLMAGRESETWNLRSLHAAILAWWLAEYSGRYLDPNHQDVDLQNIDFDAEAVERSGAFMKVLNDGAFHFMLSLSQDVRPIRWYDPLKSNMVSYLLQDTSILSTDSPPPEDFFKALIMQQFQNFADSFITNMPDTLRKLKVEEDDQRRRLLQRPIAEQPLHLERFLVVISYAYDDDADAAEDFWNDRESNLYGFLQWAARRQPTQRIAMFCEMLRSISSGDANAQSAHHFLMEEGASAAGKVRRTASLSYTHIYNELIEFQRNVHEPRKSIQGGLYAATNKNPQDNIIEPESAIMLESYLRLLAHLSRQSAQARDWMLSHTEYNLIGICFQLCNDDVESNLRAAAFETVSALLSDKSSLQAAAVWNNLDEWTVSGFNVAAKQSGALRPLPQDELWAILADGYDESLAIVRLLTSLMEPYPDDEGLNDTLPFPESLGSTRRMPGIDKFVDFALHRVFANRTPEIQDTLQQNVMSWTCLRFIVACLSTFNENLVVFANRSSIPVDAVIGPSSLVAYVTLHPFTRVMEWLFSDKVLKALFAASHQDVDEVDAAHSDSPLVQSLMMSIETMDLIMKLQATYLDIVRPVIKQQSSVQHSPVSNTALASFEDAVLNNLQLIVDLGLYCGTGHEGLTIASLKLLEKLSSSRKLAVSPAGFGQRSSRSKIIGILEKDNEADRIGRCLAGLMKEDPDEIEAGPEASGIVVKLRILDFLNSCLAAVSVRPTIAHILLGFSCANTTVSVTEGSLWANGQSLFHSILILAVGFPDNDGLSFSSWMSEVKSRCWGVLQKLWRSPLTAAIVMDELRINEFLFEQAPRLMLIDANTPWDGMSFAQGLEEQASGELSEFFCGSPSVALQNVLFQRAAFLDYESRELRLTVREEMPTMRSRIQSVLLGTTIRPGMDPTPTHNIFDLFDFIELDFTDRAIPEHKLTEGVSLSMCQEEKNGVTLYALPLLEQLFLLRIKAWRIEGAFKDEQEELVMVELAKQMLALFTEYNRRAELLRYHKDILRSWVQLLKVTVQSCDFDGTARTSFVLQTLQVILPKLELAYNADIFTATELASLGETLIQKIDFDSPAFEQTRTADFANDRLSQLFRTALMGIYSPTSTTELREYCYQTCFRYIQGTREKATKGSSLGRHTLNTVKNCGSHLLEVMCDDAYSGQGSCRISALLLLGSLVHIATTQESKYMLETFVALNFIGVLVDNIKHIPSELKAAAAPQIPSLLTSYDVSLSLLFRICRTRVGAAHVLNAGLFPAVRASTIFTVDPDIGLEFDNPNALARYYDLMLAVLRVINAAVISRGLQNEQSLAQARDFLAENRNCVVAIFKRSVSVGLAKGDVGEGLGELVDGFTVLVGVSGFLEHENESSVKQARANMFS
ncbi:hypothetical protein EJ04DRAFT_562782 [Polyplosphaeria fusca]|uniref:Uncharacterized protein n=1 Tax=Polyplosphaeria fusca TaxID=682080 RepID=A0A9P4R3Y3_9PLEO|nr:hypothetical protein EJ04DRAFT_562782 [Polyplosphaeria fusca]